MASACRHVAHCCTPAFLYLHSLTAFPQTSVSPRWGCLSQSAAARLPLSLPLSRPGSGAACCRTSSRRRFAYKAPREGIVTGECTPSLSLEDRAPEDLHIPVLAAEVAEVFRGVKGGIHRFIDGTVGMGGHSSAICREHGDTLELLLGIDQDPAALKLAARRLGTFCSDGRAAVVSGNFEDISRLAREKGIEKGSVDGILLDIGYSSLQIDDAVRGFSFMRDGPLDMRMDPRQTLTAAHIVNTWGEEEIANVLFEYGEERKSRAMARKIVAAREIKPIQTTFELCSVLGGYHAKGVHPATLAFQGLRIAVNRELHVLQKVLPHAAELLRPGGRLAVISFHSLEDRIVKSWFLEIGRFPDKGKKNKYAHFSQVGQGDVDKSDDDNEHSGSDDSSFIILTKRPIIASEGETKMNPRARSAKMRVLEKIEQTK